MSTHTLPSRGSPALYSPSLLGTEGQERRKREEKGVQSLHAVQ